MAKTARFAVLLKDLASPAAEPLKRAFKTFSHLTDADAVRLAVCARGILMRHLGRDAARALQSALQAEGVGVVILAENDLPQLPEPRSLHRVELWPQAFTVYDLLGRPAAIAWPDISFVAAGAAQHFDVTRTESERIQLRFNPLSGLWPKRVKDTGHRVESDSQLLLEILVAPGPTRYQIDAAKFPFRFVIDRPGLALEEKFIWLVREICRHATRAALNAGARSLRDGAETVPAYLNPQTLADEIVWLLWQAARGRSPAA